MNNNELTNVTKTATHKTILTFDNGDTLDIDGADVGVSGELISIFPKVREKEYRVLYTSLTLDKHGTSTAQELKVYWERNGYFSTAHVIGVGEHAIRNLDGATTLSVAASAGDTLITLADPTGFAIGGLLRVYGSDIFESGHLTIVNLVGSDITLNRPLDNDYEIGDNVDEVSENMIILAGTISAPVSYKVKPRATENYEITRIIITMLSGSAMDDGKFGSQTKLTNGVVLRTNISGKFRTIGTWKSNNDMKDDMYDVQYSNKAASGEFGLDGRWTFIKGGYTVALNGGDGDYLEVLVQDDLTGQISLKVNAQGRFFGG